MVVYAPPGTATPGTVVLASLWNGSARDNIQFFRQFLPDPTAGSQLLVSTGVAGAGWQSNLPSGVQATDLTVPATATDLLLYGPNSVSGYSNSSASAIGGSFWATSGVYAPAGRPGAGHVKAEAFDGGTFSGTTITGSGTITGADLVVNGGAVWTNSLKVLATDLLISGPTSVSGYSGGQGSVMGGSFWATSSAFVPSSRPGAGYIVGENVRATATFRGNQFTSESGSIAMFGPVGVVTTGGASVYLASLVATSSAYGNGSASPGSGVVQAEYFSAAQVGHGLLLPLGGQMYDQTTAIGGSGTAPADGATTIRANADRLDVLDEAGTTLLFRLANVNSAPVWKGYTVWHQGNMGSGGGLDADLLDGSHASAFVATSGATMSGNLDTHGELTFLDALDGIHFGNGGYLHDMTTASGLSAGAGNGSTQLTANDDRLDVINESNGALLFRVAQANTAPVWKGQTVWHAGNMGSGSTLDADTVDGVHGTAVALKAGSNMTGWLSWLTNAVGVSFSEGGTHFDQSAATAGEQRSVIGAAGDIFYVLTEDLAHALFRADYAATRPAFKGGDLALYSDVTTEATTRASADTTEATARASADTTLTNSITAAVNTSKQGTPSGDLTLTASFADFAGATVTVDKDGYWLFEAGVYFSKTGSQSISATFQVQLVVNGSGQTPIAVEGHGLPVGTATMSWIVQCTNGYVGKLQCKDTNGSGGNKAVAVNSNFTATWLHS